MRHEERPLAPPETPWSRAGGSSGDNCRSPAVFRRDFLSHTSFLQGAASLSSSEVAVFPAPPLCRGPEPAWPDSHQTATEEVSENRKVPEARPKSEVSI